MLRQLKVLSAVFLLGLPATAQAADEAEIVEVRKIWDQGVHNAFTDLVRHSDRWYCVFREGETHVSPDGSLRVLTSADGERWESTALITSAGSDLRDAKISIAPDGRLCLCGAGVQHGPQGSTYQSYLWYSKDGKDWGEAIPIGDENYWIWRLVWHRDVAYCVGYRTGPQKGLRLYRSQDGRHFETLVAELGQPGYVNETSRLFLPDDRALCFVRRDGEPNSALLGHANPDYTEWTWHDLGVRVGGPQLLQLPDERIVVGGRRYPGGAKTQLWWLDPQANQLTEIVTLPSGGDTSYPGLVFHDGLLWMSYYSSHEGKTSIYLAKVRLPAAP